MFVMISVAYASSVSAAEPVLAAPWSFAISPRPLTIGGAFRQVGRYFIYEYAPGEETWHTLPVKPSRVRRIDDTVVFALGEHGVWVGRLGRRPGAPGSAEPGLRIEARHRFADPVVDFTIENGRVTPLTGVNGHPVLLQGVAVTPKTTRPPRLLDVSYGDERIVNPKWIVEATLLAGVQMHPEQDGVFHYCMPLSLRLGYSPVLGHTVGVSFFAEEGEEKIFLKPNDLHENWWSVDTYFNPLFLFYRYSLQAVPLSLQLEPLKADYFKSDDEYGLRLTIQWARALQGLRVGVEAHLDKTENITRFGLWLVVGWNGPPWRTP